MQIYSRENQHLVVIDEVPRWFIVDDLGKGVLEALGSGQTCQQAMLSYPAGLRDDVAATYGELEQILGQSSLRTATVVSHDLMSRTTAALVCVTRNCNMKEKCPHCYVDASGARGRELGVPEHAALAADIRETLATNPRVSYKVNLTGGEPFWRRDIADIIRVYHEAGLGVTMSTNALLIQEKHLDVLHSAEVALSVSVDGSSAATHDAIRGRGAYRRVIDKVKWLVEHKIRVGINCLMHEGNLHQLEQMITQAYELGCNGFNPINLIRLGRGQTCSLRRVPETEMFPRIARHLEAHPEQIRLLEFSSQFASLGAALLAGIACESCGLGQRPCVYVSELGDVFPCPNTQRPEFLLGNIRTEKFSECVRWDHPVYQRLRGIKVGTMNEKCGRCDVRFFCGGDCRGETYNVTGDLQAPYISCSDRHDSLIGLMWIAAESGQLFAKRTREYLENADV